MPQLTLNDPIDGAELKEIILKRIGDQLDRDCTLSNDMAYAGFTLNYVINLSYLRTSTKGAETMVWGQTGEGSVEGGEAALLADLYETDSPNAARVDHDLPIPVMVKTPAGEEKRKVKLGRPPQKATKE